MFRNPGRKIKTLAIVIFVLLVLIQIVLGLAVAIVGGSLALEYYGSGARALAIAGGIGIIVVGSLLAWLSVLLLYAYGSLVSDVMVIKRRLHELRAPAEGKE